MLPLMSWRSTAGLFAWGVEGTTMDDTTPVACPVTGST